MILLAFFGLSLALQGSPARAADTGVSACPLPELSMADVERKAYEQCAETVRLNSGLPFEKESDDSYWGLIYNTVRCSQGLLDSGIGLVKGTVSLAKGALAFAWECSDLTDEAMVDYYIKTNTEPQCLKDAIARWESFKYLALHVPELLHQQGVELTCLPSRLQSKFYCGLLADAYLLYLSPGKVIQALPEGAKITEAMIQSVQKLKAAGAFSGEGDVAAKIDRVTGAAVQGLEQLKEPQLVMSFGRNSRLVKRWTPGQTEPALQFEHFENGVKQVKPIAMDPLAGVYDVKDAGKLMMNEAINHAARNAAGTPAAVIQIDINNLGILNHTAGSVMDGDRYITAVANAVKSTLRKDDVIFRNGGDEFVMILNDVSTSKKVFELEQKISQKVLENTEVTKILTNFQNQLLKEQKALSEATTYDSLGANKSLLSPSERESASKNFEGFRAQYLADKKFALRKLLNLRPSISIGAKMLKEGDRAGDVLTATGRQADEIKIAYKRATGQDVGKYFAAPAVDAADLNPDAVPEILPPLE